MVRWPCVETKNKKSKRGSKGEGTLFRRGRMWHFKAPNGERFAIGKQVKSDAIAYKHKKLAELQDPSQPRPEGASRTMKSRKMNSPPWSGRRRELADKSAVDVLRLSHHERGSRENVGQSKNISRHY
ncbi:MAG: hypothetical protein ABIR70_07815 [Bryobacteraceae bacterium]